MADSPLPVEEEEERWVLRFSWGDLTVKFKRSLYADCGLNAGLVVLCWDIENCCIPKSAIGAAVLDRVLEFIKCVILKKFPNFKDVKQIKIYVVSGETGYVPKVKNLASYENVQLIYISNPKRTKNAADEKIKNIVYDNLALGKRETVFALISGDEDFHRLLKDLAKGCLTVLIYKDDKSTNKCCQSASFSISYKELCKNLPHIKLISQETHQEKENGDLSIHDTQQLTAPRKVFDCDEEANDSKTSLFEEEMYGEVDNKRKSKGQEPLHSQETQEEDEDLSSHDTQLRCVTDSPRLETKNAKCANLWDLMSYPVPPNKNALQFLEFLERANDCTFSGCEKQRTTALFNGPTIPAVGLKFSYKANLRYCPDIIQTKKEMINELIKDPGMHKLGIITRNREMSIYVADLMKKPNGTCEIYLIENLDDLAKDLPDDFTNNEDFEVQLIVSDSEYKIIKKEFQAKLCEYKYKNFIKFPKRIAIFETKIAAENFIESLDGAEICGIKIQLGFQENVVSTELDQLKTKQKSPRKVLNPNEKADTETTDESKTSLLEAKVLKIKQQSESDVPLIMTSQSEGKQQDDKGVLTSDNLQGQSTSGGEFKIRDCQRTRHQTF